MNTCNIYLDSFNNKYNKYIFCYKLLSPLYTHIIAIMIKNTTKAIMKPIIVDNPQPLLFNFFILSPKIIIQN